MFNIERWLKRLHTAPFKQPRRLVMTRSMTVAHVSLISGQPEETGYVTTFTIIESLN